MEYLQILVNMIDLKKFESELKMSQFHKIAAIHDNLYGSFMLQSI